MKDVIETAGIATPLRQSYTIASGLGNARGTFFRFVNSYVKSVEGSTRAMAAAAYQAAKFWTNQGEIISQYPQDIELDRELARMITGRGAYTGEYTGFRTLTEITAVDPVTGNARTYGFYQDWYRPPTLAEAYALAREDLAPVIGRSPPLGGSTDIDDYTLTYSISDWAFYAP